MAKKEESSKKRDHSKDEKIHAQKHEAPKIHAMGLGCGTLMRKSWGRLKERK